MGVKMQGQIDALFFYAAEGILVVDEQGLITRVNPSGQKLFGYEEQELIGQPVEILIPRSLAHRHTQHRANFMHSPHARAMGIGMALLGMKKNGSEFPVEVSLSPYISEGRPFVIAFVVDITLRRQAEEKLKNYSAELEKQVKNRTLILEEAIQELERTKKDLNQALAKEKDLNELKSRFVSMASHEFRTPLATMMSSLALVDKYGEQNDKEKQTRHIGKIKNSIHNLTDILNDMLSVSKLEEGQIVNEPALLETEAFVSEVISELSGLVKGQQQIHYHHTGRKTALLDPKLMRHILFNLVSNALKFSADDQPVDVITEGDHAFLRLTVKDHGIGIPERDQEHLFDRFFRGQNAVHIQGTGLGLNIVAKYVELMQGNISVKSIENKGTTFTIIFPQ